MSRSKYIVVKNGNFPEAFIFPETIDHDHFAQRVVRGTDWEEQKSKILGAGFVRITASVHESVSNIPWPEIHVTAYGESTSLGIKSRPEQDKLYLVKALGLDEC